MKRQKNPPSNPPWDFEVRLLAWLALCVSVLSFLYYLKRGQILLYGDAVAHINIARKVFDSKTPGLLQLGTVWLPLPHLLMIPFLLSPHMWQFGAGGSIPSLVAYVFGVLGIFRLVRGVLQKNSGSNRAASIAAWTAATVFAANPNLIYMQSTAMGEALYLAFFLWAAVFFNEWIRGNQNALTKCGLCLAATCWIRYDGWFLTIAIGSCVLFVTFLPGARSNGPGRAALIKFMLIAAAAPVLWLAYNAAVYRNPLEFENGPYSAKAIEKKTESSASPGHPGSHYPITAALYFLKAAESNVATNKWLQRLWLLLAALATGAAVVFVPKQDGATNALARALPLLALWVPLPFYALSVAYGGVPIFVPAWWPFSHYNVRYGLQLLPALAMGLGLLVYLALQWNITHNQRRAVFAGVIVLVIGSYVAIWRADPICYAEAAINMRSRIALEKQVAKWLQALPPDATLLMYLGGHPGAVQQAGVPVAHIINEGNHRMWKQPSDPDGLWEQALADPARFADYIVAFEGDSVWQAIQGKRFKELVEIKVTGQERAILYQAR